MSLPEARPHDRVLEIGFGPGLAILDLSRIAHEGYVFGIDHSELMLRQARRRNAAGIGRGVVDLRLGSVDELPVFDAPFDKILAVNAALFWNQPDARLEELRQLLRPGGLIALANQPRSRGERRDVSGQGPGDRGGAGPSRILRGAGGNHAPEAFGRVRARHKRSRRVTAPAARRGPGPLVRAPSAERSAVDCAVARFPWSWRFFLM